MPPVAAFRAQNDWRVPTERAPDAPLPEHVRAVRAAQAGDRDGFGRLYALFSRAVYAVLLARVPAADAPDLVQEVFLRAWLSIRELREPAAFGTWILTMARREAIDHLRRARPSVPLDEDRWPARGGPHLSAEAAGALDAIHRLPEAYRETLTLRLVEGYSGPEIAGLTGLTPDSVRVNLHRGFKLLRQMLSEAP
jgi:RNA polymerase sigma-70 factor (ECF subfamily)